MTCPLSEVDDIDGPNRLGCRNGAAIAGKFGALPLGVILLLICECGDPDTDPFILVLDETSSCLIKLVMCAVSACFCWC